MWSRLATGIVGTGIVGTGWWMYGQIYPKQIQPPYIKLTTAQGKTTFCAIETQFQQGLNVDISEFEPDPKKCGSGYHFTNKRYVGDWYKTFDGRYTHFVRVDVPSNARVVLSKDKGRADRILMLSEPRPLSELFETEEECVQNVEWAYKLLTEDQWTENVAMTFIKTVGRLEHVPVKVRTLSVCDASLDKYPYNFLAIPKELKTRALCRKALMGSGFQDYIRKAIPNDISID